MHKNATTSLTSTVLDIELESSRIATGDLIITEFLQGFREDNQFLEAKELMDSLEYYDFVGREMAINAAQNFRRLRKKGITIRKTIDVLIATFCIEYGFELLHSDRDFDPMEEVLGLKVKR
jgi:predicted nucleic acid-binding protein